MFQGSSNSWGVSAAGSCRHCSQECSNIIYFWIPAATKPAILVSTSLISNMFLSCLLHSLISFCPLSYWSGQRCDKCLYHEPDTPDRHVPWSDYSIHTSKFRNCWTCSTSNIHNLKFVNHGRLLICVGTVPYTRYYQSSLLALKTMVVAIIGPNTTGLLGHRRTPICWKILSSPRQQPLSWITLKNQVIGALVLMHEVCSTGDASIFRWRTDGRNGHLPAVGTRARHLIGSGIQTLISRNLMER